MATKDAGIGSSQPRRSARGRIEPWNIVDVEHIEGAARLRRRFVAVAALWSTAFLIVVLGALVGFEVAEAAPALRLAASANPFLPLFLTGLLAGGGGLSALLWRRLLTPGRIRIARRVK
jgi:hypothetical protein